MFLTFVSPCFWLRWIGNSRWSFLLYYNGVYEYSSLVKNAVCWKRRVYQVRIRILFYFLCQVFSIGSPLFKNVIFLSNFKFYFENIIGGKNESVVSGNTHFYFIIFYIESWALYRTHGFQNCSILGRTLRVQALMKKMK